MSITLGIKPVPLSLENKSVILPSQTVQLYCDRK